MQPAEMGRRCETGVVFDVLCERGCEGVEDVVLAQLAASDLEALDRGGEIGLHGWDDVGEGCCLWWWWFFEVFGLGFGGSSGSGKA